MGGIRAGCSPERCLTPLGKRGAFMIGGETYVRRAREPFHPLSPLLFHFAGERNEEFSCSGEQQRCRRRRCTYGRSHTAGATREKERERKQQVSPALPPPPFPPTLPGLFFPARDFVFPPLPLLSKVRTTLHCSRLAFSFPPLCFT